MTNVEAFIFALVLSAVTGAACYGMGWSAGAHYVLYGYSVFTGKRGKVFVKRGVNGSGVPDNRNGNEGAASVSDNERGTGNLRAGHAGNNGLAVFRKRR